MDEVEEIKSKIDIVGLIGEYVPLKRAGVNWKGNCPFHNEKSPSFMVNAERQFYYCFGCHEGGDIFSFLQKKENLEFPEVLKILAHRAGVQLKTFDASAQNQRTRLYDLIEQATDYWQKTLYSGSGKEALDYLHNRGLTDEIIAEFRLGWSNDSWDDIINYLKAQKFTEAEINLAGLSIKRDTGGGYYDRFRARVMFPIIDHFGNPVGFSARTLKKDEPAKYINTPETSLYKKGKVLYGLNKAKEMIKNVDYAIVVEGNVDVISCFKAGSKNTIAVSGTALTPDQIHLIKRYTNNVIFCFDMDQAGQNAANRSIDIALENEMNIKVITLINAKDPDECIKNNPNDWTLAVKNAVSIMQYHFNKIFVKYDISKIEEKKEAAALMLTEIKKLKNPVERDHWLQQLAGKLGTSSSVLNEMIKSEIKVLPKKEIAEKPLEPEKVDPADKLLDVLFSIFFNFPNQLAYAIVNLPVEIVHQEYQALYTFIIDCYNKDNEINTEGLIKMLSDQNYLNYNENEIRRLILFKDNKDSNLQFDDWRAEMVRLVNRIKKDYYQRLKREKQALLADTNLSNEQMAQIMKDLQDINFKLNKL